VQLSAQQSNIMQPKTKAASVIDGKWQGNPFGTRFYGGAKWHFFFDGTEPAASLSPFKNSENLCCASLAICHLRRHSNCQRIPAEFLLSAYWVLSFGHDLVATVL